MSITPSISASGYLRLDVTLNVSVFQGQFSGAIPPPKVTRVIQTSVNVPDGDTMVIGGIIVDNKSDSGTSVPWLGELPIVGTLFRRDTKNAQRTTLYFFVTPHIMRDLAFADLAELSYKTKISAAEVIGADRIRMIDPRFGGGAARVDLSGFDVPLYRSPKSGEVGPEAIGLPPGQTSVSSPPQTQPPATEPPGAAPEGAQKP
jgi:general secretion pathway protein D